MDCVNIMKTFLCERNYTSVELLTFRIIERSSEVEPRNYFSITCS